MKKVRLVITAAIALSLVGLSIFVFDNFKEGVGSNIAGVIFEPPAPPPPPPPPPPPVPAPNPPAPMPAPPPPTSKPKTTTPPPAPVPVPVPPPATEPEEESYVVKVQVVRSDNQSMANSEVVIDGETYTLDENSYVELENLPLGNHDVTASIDNEDQTKTFVLGETNIEEVVQVVMEVESPSGEVQTIPWLTYALIVLAIGLVLGFILFFLFARKKKKKKKSKK